MVVKEVEMGEMVEKELVFFFSGFVLCVPSKKKISNVKVMTTDRSLPVSNHKEKCCPENQWFVGNWLSGSVEVRRELGKFFVGQET